MNFTPKFYKRGFFIFGIFNLVFIGLFLLAPKPRPDQKSHLKHVIEKLNDILALDSKQQIAMEEIFALHQSEIDSIEKISQNNHKKIIACEAKLIQKQQNEMNALKKKLEANLNERLKLRETEH